MPDVEGIDPVVQRIVARQPPMLLGGPDISIGTLPRRSEFVFGTPGRDQDDAVMSRRTRLLSSSTQAYGKPAPRKARGAGPTSGAGSASAPAAPAAPRFEDILLPDTYGLSYVDIGSQDHYARPTCDLEPWRTTTMIQCTC